MLLSYSGLVTATSFPILEAMVSAGETDDTDSILPISSGGSAQLEEKPPPSKHNRGSAKPHINGKANHMMSNDILCIYIYMYIYIYIY